MNDLIWSKIDTKSLNHHLAYIGVSRNTAATKLNLRISDVNSALNFKGLKVDETLNLIASEYGFFSNPLIEEEANILAEIKNTWSPQAAAFIATALKSSNYAHPKDFTAKTGLASGSTITRWVKGHTTPRPIPLVRVLYSLGLTLKELQAAMSSETAPIAPVKDEAFAFQELNSFTLNLNHMIEELGGPRVFAKKLEVTVGTVSGWRRGNKPQGRFREILESAVGLTYDEAQEELNFHLETIHNSENPVASFIEKSRRINNISRSKAESLLPFFGRRDYSLDDIESGRVELVAEEWNMCSLRLLASAINVSNEELSSLLFKKAPASAHLGEKLKAFRLRKLMTSIHVNKAVGMHAAVLMNMEMGRMPFRSPGNLDLLLDLYGVTMADVASSDLEEFKAWLPKTIDGLSAEARSSFSYEDLNSWMKFRTFPSAVELRKLVDLSDSNAQAVFRSLLV